MANIHYHRTDEFWRKEEKYEYLEQHPHRSQVEWNPLTPNKKHIWLTAGLEADFDTFLPIGTKDAKAGEGKAIFTLYSNGNDSGRDRWVYNFNKETLIETTRLFSDTYNSEVNRWFRAGKPTDIDEFLINDDRKIKWTRNAKRDLRQGRFIDFSVKNIHTAIYRPFTKQLHYPGKIFNKEIAQFQLIFPRYNGDSGEAENQVICLRAVGNSKPFHCLITDHTPDLHLTGDSQCFPFYTYDEDGSNRRENITDWALERFRAQYGKTSKVSETFEVSTSDAVGHASSVTTPANRDRHVENVTYNHPSTPPDHPVENAPDNNRKIEKWDIFYYVYGLLHHPDYRKTYAANLRRELPRIPFVANFWGFAQAGQKLAHLHINYEQQPEYPLQFIENPDEPLNWHVEKMRLSKDKTQLKYNNFLTLAGIPPETFEYRLGNRSALDWIIDQYRLKTDKRSGIVNDPNNLDDPQYIVRLIGQVVTVSLETVKIVNALPPLDILETK